MSRRWEKAWELANAITDAWFESTAVYPAHMRAVEWAWWEATTIGTARECYLVGASLALDGAPIEELP